MSKNDYSFNQPGGLMPVRWLIIILIDCVLNNNNKSNFFSPVNSGINQTAR